MRRPFNTITIRDVAQSLNISISTVSRALRDTYDVSQTTRQKVLEKASELNYKPNYSAIGLVQGKTHNISIILPLVTNYYFSTVITGIQQVAYNRDYNVILYLTNDSQEKELQIIQNLPLGCLDGLLVSTSFRSNAFGHYQKIIKEGSPVVFFDRSVDGVHTSRVLQDDFNGAYQATEHLIASGYTKIAHITGPKEMIITQKRLAGYRQALRRYKLPLNDKWVIHSGFSQECGEQDTLHLLEGGSKPDAIFAINDRKAIGAMVALKKKNIRIGTQIGVAGFTNDPISGIISPTLTTVAEPAFEIGKISCELLLKHLQKKYFEPEEIILPGKLYIRESTMR
ncbi:LacI family DNA-binding transcriptional regulator [Compostibacter hankyongensis]|uniref:LacI family DNA-binding transcriptional regulator n=1 Tax=Compostibacter hankyongensis TaxID=1007089 RepID=A0ABP8FWR8_9BACT